MLLSFKASYNFRVALQNLLRKEQMLDSNFAEERNLSEELMNTADLVNAIIKFWQHGRHMGRHDHKMMLKELLTIAEQS